MKTEYEITIEAETSQECDHVMQALLDVKKALKPAELIKLATKIKNDPGLLKKAKAFGLI